jgi:HK97 family phage major capsid protein
MNPREEYKALLKELYAFDEKRKAGTLSDEDREAMKPKLARAQELKPAVDELDRQDGALSSLGTDFDRLRSRGSVTDRDRTDPGEPGGSGGTGTTGQLGGRGGPGGQRMQRLGEYVVGTEAYKARLNGRFAVELPGLWMPSADYALQPFERLRLAQRGRENYALVAGGGLSIPLEMRPGTPAIEPILSLRPTVRDALSNQNTTFNLIPFIRQDLDTTANNAGFFDPDGTNVKPESDVGLIDDEAPVRTVATTFPVPEVVLDDVAGLRNFIDAQLIDFLKQAEDDALLNGTGTPPEIKGILQMDIQVADATYFSSNPVAGAGEDREDIDRLTRAMRLVRRVGRATPSAVIMSPAALEWFLEATDANDDYYSGNPFTTTDLPRFRGLPIIESDKIADDHALVLDGRFFTVYDRQEARVDAGYVDKQFTQNWITLRAEERLALAGTRPQAAVDVTFANAGS